MISLILGHKGSGKTKHLITCLNEAIETSKGNVVCVEKETKLTFDIDRRARLIATDDFEIKGYHAFYGFLAGVCAQAAAVAFLFIYMYYLSYHFKSPFLLIIRGISAALYMIALFSRNVNRAA